MELKTEKQNIPPASMATGPAGESKKVDLRSRLKLPDGFWSTPGGKDGLQGTVAGVSKALDEMKLDEHWKSAIKSAIASEILRTGGNFVVVHAHAQRGDDDLIVAIHIKASTKNI